jgi:hypothetical protein
MHKHNDDAFQKLSTCFDEHWKVYEFKQQLCESYSSVAQEISSYFIL